jgi:CRISPR-associated endonuclease/helicase Cas3
VIPYTSIIEQTADQFRDIFGDEVVEHHSNFDPPDEKDETLRSRLACENWDAPLVVTTSVQFFESLFADRTSRCRKLHNIAQSVVILDEAQLLPPEFLVPILAAMRELVAHYGVTFVLCTATQPALNEHRTSNYHFPGLPDAREITEDPEALHEALRRVDVHIPRNLAEPCSWGDLAAELAGHPSVLCVVNRRDDARALWELMPEGTVHLSALMCGAHRSETIKGIKAKLSAGEPVRVISTQLVEAGVDVDFPVVYRALAGLDSVAQAAGRCNREGCMPQRGQVFVFVPPSQAPAGLLRQAQGLGRQLLGENVADPLAPEWFERFFRELYWLQGDRLDRHGIVAELTDGQGRYAFRTAAQKFRLIDESQSAGVFVLWGEGAKWTARLERVGPERWLSRKLQRYLVNLPRHAHDSLAACGAIREVHPGLFVQGHGALYHKDLGFRPEIGNRYEPDDLII